MSICMYEPPSQEYMTMDFVTNMNSHPYPPGSAGREGSSHPTGNSGLATPSCHMAGQSGGWRLTAGGREGGGAQMGVPPGGIVYIIHIIVLDFKGSSSSVVRAFRPSLDSSCHTDIVCDVSCIE